MMPSTGLLVKRGRVSVMGTLMFPIKAFICFLLFVGAIFSSDQFNDIVTKSANFVDKQKDIIFDYSKDRCNDKDTPDAPPRFVLNYKGDIVLFSTQDVNRIMVSHSFDHFVRICDPIFTGKHLDNPGEFNDRQWLASFWTDNGRKIYAVIHDEYWGHMRKELCRGGSYRDCWRNSLTTAVSLDGASSFHELEAPENTLATIPYKYMGFSGHPVGYFQPTNIVKYGTYYYFMFRATNYRAQRAGTCVVRTQSIANPRSWRAWDGRGYDAKFLDPYISDLRPDTHVCSPVGAGSLFDVGSLSFDLKTNLFVALTSRTNQTDKFPGAYVSTSSDMIHWSPAVLLCSESELATDDVQRDLYGFFSLIDESSSSRNFDSISSHPNLYIYYIEMDQKHAPYVRNMVRRRVLFLPITKM